LGDPLEGNLLLFYKPLHLEAQQVSTRIEVRRHQYSKTLKTIFPNNYKVLKIRRNHKSIVFCILKLFPYFHPINKNFSPNGSFNHKELLTQLLHKL
jgi:hypothetical protein